VPDDAPERIRLRADGVAPGPLHNNCSGKHAGFLMLAQRLGGGSEYVELGHPVQKAVRAAFEEMTGAESPGWGIDGCSAPNFACTLHGLAWAMARMADPRGLGPAREAAARRLVAAMLAHPLLVAGEGRACSELMAAAGGRVAIKTGAEALFTAILPERGLGIALKIEDGTARGSECAIAAILARMGAIAPDDPALVRRLTPAIPSRRGELTGAVRPAPGFWDGGAAIAGL
jgi:L-asparaginase II